jgi:hypothetical protein
MHRTINNVSMIAPVPTPTPTPTQVPEGMTTPVPTISPTTVSLNPEQTPVVQLPSPTASIWSGSIVTILLLAGTVAYAIYFKNGRRE